MMLLTASVLGLQFAWGVEMTYVNVYLLSLGMSKTWLSFVWLAGPLSGLIMQPLIGVLSDKSTSKYGRRRPFMIGGSIIVTIGLIIMAWAKEIASMFTPVDSSAQSIFAIVLATIGIFVTDFAINSVQACCRALIVDTLPPSRQEIGNAWAGRMIAIGHLLGYVLGYLDLVAGLHGFLGDTQLKSLCIISSAALLCSVGITSFAVSERVLMKSFEHHSLSLFEEMINIFKVLFQTVRNIPANVTLIFKIQLCAWYGWFSFLFYSATWAGEIYTKYHSDRQESSDRVGDIARVGSMTMMIFSIVSLVFSLALPELLEKAAIDTSIRSTSAFSTRPSSKVQLGYFVIRRLITLGRCILLPLQYMRVVLQNLFDFYEIDICDFWFASHVVYAVASFSSGFVRSIGQAGVVVGLCGFSWAVTTWAPFALLAEEILLLNNSQDEPNDETGEQLQHIEVARPASPSKINSTALQSHQHRNSNASEMDFFEEDSESLGITSDESGVYLGIHNIAITAPQFVSSFGSFVIFSIFSDSKEAFSDEGDGGAATAITLQIGGLTALAAAYFTRKLKAQRSIHQRFLRVPVQEENY
jgi:solute carrier family 45, member 1/2/4